MYIARQPIFNKSLEVYGYELLFRSSIESSVFSGASSTSATATVLEGLFEMGMDKIVDSKKSFVNFDYDFIFSDSIELFDSSNLIVEVLETVKPDGKILDRLNFLRRKGYKIALDDFVEHYEYPLMPVAHIIKYDIMATPLHTIKADVSRALSDKKVLLAEKVETNEEFLEAKNMGFHLFQGYFFSKPSIIGKTSGKESMKSHYAKIIIELRKEEPSYQKLTEIMKTDINLTYRLFRVISTKKNEDLVYSIKRALVQMGLKELERWINILMLRDLSEDKPPELVKISLIRTKFGEYISQHSRYKTRRLEISTMCLFSTIDAVLDQTMEEALDGIMLTPDIRDALISSSGELSDINELIKSYETGDWNRVKCYCEKININEEKLYKGYLKALEWTNETLIIV